jgi:catechol 2,3-dioxygenase-like lactoylglutathione lyase family enzyme
MPHHLKKLTPNLVVSDVAASVAFYRDVLGFSLGQTVPESAPYVFAIVQRDSIEIFLNAPDTAAAEYSTFKDRPLGGTLTLYTEVDNVRQAYEALKDRVHVVKPLETQWYGVTEFAFTDPDGYVITFAERDA